MQMNRFLGGILVGLGLGGVIALLIIVMRNEEMQRQLQARYEGLRGALPSGEQMKQTGQQVAGRVSQVAGQLKESAQQAVSKVRESGGDSGDLAQQSSGEVQQAEQDVAGTLEQATPSAQQDE
jgi:hypothetical protein